MAKQPEAKFRDKVMKDLSHLPESWWIRIELPYRSGVPDIFGCVCGHFVAFEAKKNEKEEPKKLQTYVIHKILEAGGSSLVIHPKNWPQVLSELINYINRRDKNADLKLQTH